MEIPLAEQQDKIMEYKTKNNSSDTLKTAITTTGQLTFEVNSPSALFGTAVTPSVSEPFILRVKSLTNTEYMKCVGLSGDLVTIEAGGRDMGGDGASTFAISDEVIASLSDTVISNMLQKDTHINN